MSQERTLQQLTPLIEELVSSCFCTFFKPILPQNSSINYHVLQRKNTSFTLHAISSSASSWFINDILASTHTTSSSLWFIYNESSAESFMSCFAVMDFVWFIYGGAGVNISFMKLLKTSQHPSLLPYAQTVYFSRESMGSGGPSGRQGILHKCWKYIDIFASFQFALKPQIPFDWTPPVQYLLDITDTNRKPFSQKRFVLSMISNCAHQRITNINLLLHNIVERNASFSNVIDHYGTCRGFSHGQYYNVPNQSSYHLLNLSHPHFQFPTFRNVDKEHVLYNYKFGLAFENTHSPYYTTEKVWEVLRAGSIPIYYGDTSMLDHLNVPPHTIIICSFVSNTSVNECVDEILLAARNESQYSKYFEWQTNETFLQSLEQFGFGFKIRDRRQMMDDKLLELKIQPVNSSTISIDLLLILTYCCIILIFLSFHLLQCFCYQHY